ncbi:MAG: hypothetical protein JWP89_656 [Schlesneria sp.]|nr:hypothetical protein [Schlesneria sp.]
MINRTIRNGHSIVAVGLTLFLCGCSETLKTSYLDPQGKSINGIAGFVELVKSTGREVQVWQAISPRLKEDVDAVVIFQSEFDQIPNDRIANIRQMLRESSIQTVVIVIRDSDCEIDYWRQVAGMAELSDKDKTTADESMKRARRDLKLEAFKEFEPENGFYGLKRADRTNQPDVIPVNIETEDEPIQVSAKWPLNRQLDHSDDTVILWSTGDESLLTEDLYFTGQQVLVLASAAPLLNGGLVDPGNRQLAEELVKYLPEGKVVVTLSSRWSDGSFAESPSIWHFLRVHPHGWIFGQTLLALALFCWWKLPIFGRSKVAVNTEGVRFGRHIEALGALLQRTRDAAFARQLLRDWHRAESRRGPDKVANANTNTTSTRK